MTLAQQTDDSPEGWHWGIGNRSKTYYTHWLYTDKILYEDGEFGYEAQIFWDKGQDHTVAFYQIERLKCDGDPVVSEYPTETSRHVTEEEARKAAIETAKQLR